MDRMRTHLFRLLLLALTLPTLADATLVDLGLVRVDPVGALRHGGLCNRVTVEVENRGPDAIRIDEPGLLELVVLDNVGVRHWATPINANPITGIAPGSRRTYSVNIDVPTAVLGSAQATTITLKAQIHASGWHAQGETNYANNVFTRGHVVSRASSCPTGGGGGNEPPPGTNNPDLAMQAFQSTIRVFQHPRCTTCHSGLSLPPSPHPSSVAGRPIGVSDCATCHHTPSPTNTIPASGIGGPVPLANSNRPWRMAPSSMTLTSTISARDACNQVKSRSPGATDRERAQAVATHVQDDDLVKWGFQPICSATMSSTGPCSNRPAVSAMTHADFVRHLSEWARHGGACP